MALTDSYTETKGLGDHKEEIRELLDRVKQRLLISYEVHDQYLKENEEFEKKYPGYLDGVSDEDSDDEDFDGNGDKEDEDSEQDLEQCGCRQSINSWISYEDAVLVKLLDEDEYIVFPEPNLRSVACPRNPRPGICMKHLV